jgi:c-di-GMP-binding flagellar brake protein YcgR
MKVQTMTHIAALSYAPEPETAGIEDFQILSRIEILSLMRAIRDQRVLLTIYFSRDEDFFVTTLLGVNPEFEELVMDMSSDAAQNERLLASQGLTAVAFIDKIKVQFTSKRAEHTTHDGRDAFRIRLPDAVLRLQRRESYRVAAPVAKPVKCSVTAPKVAGTRLDLTVVDVSSTGIGVLVDPDRLSAQPGLILRDLQLDLGNIGLVKGSLQVRHICDASHGNTRRHRLGCTFINMAGTMNILVQRYVTSLERERLMRR